LSSTLADDDASILYDESEFAGARSRRRLDPITAIRLSLAEWNRRRRFRKEVKRLLKIGPHMIADIGLTLDEARDRIEAPLWRP
jgi:uncharacterized protein YjiS (DUF1127 family)